MPPNIVDGIIIFLILAAWLFAVQPWDIRKGISGSETSYPLIRNDLPGETWSDIFEYPDFERYPWKL